MNWRPLPSLSLIASLLLLTWGAALPARAADLVYTIPNPLKLGWSNDLMYFDLPHGTDAGKTVAVEIDGQTQPAQAQPILLDGKPVTRVWFTVSIKGGKDGQAARNVTILPNKNAPSPLKATPAGDTLLIANGVYEFKLPLFTGPLAQPRALKDMPTLLRGMKLAGAGDFYGKSWFEGDALVTAASTTITQQGPVLIEVVVRYDLAPPAGEQPDSAKPWHYQATLRFVNGDPWIDITESQRTPRDILYWLQFKDDLKADTVMWIRWFGYEAFGGNVDMNFLPLQPVPKQRGPFAALRPRWNQMPGGAQDFFVTRGGKTPYIDRKTNQEVRSPDYTPDAPAVGVVAAYASRWFDPFAQTINCFAENGDTARIKFPLATGGRAYGLCVGPRSHFDSTDRLNATVRRHTDWTLIKQTHQYTLEWKRDPAKAGPHILITRAQLQQLQDDYKAKKDTPQMRILREYIERRDQLKGLDADLLAMILGEPVKGTAKPPAAGLWLQRRYQDDFLNPTQATTRNLKAGFARADLLCDGQPIGDGMSAAFGYIATDLDAWPGWNNGWSPGNPNFHTDKYMGAIYAAASMLDHPDAQKWLAFGKANFDDDLRRVLIPPDGVGFECPGYSGYSLNIQLGLAKTFKNVGFGNPLADNPMFAATANWHRHLLTPVDRRIGIRHEAPIGDTHRWTSGMNQGFGIIASSLKAKDPTLASQLMAVYNLLRDQGMRSDLLSDLVLVDPSIPAAPLESLDWGSHPFFGFGAVMRSRFNSPNETFLSFKAGPTHGHYHNDELSYHFYGMGTPLSLDYNCSYHPRGDHAALHNSMTFGNNAPFKHAGDNNAVQAAEQLGGTAHVGAFVSNPVADVIVAERKGSSLTLSPIYPTDAKFQYGYPRRQVQEIVHRRYLMLVKHDPAGPVADYLLVRDETRSAEPQQLNIHLLAREVKQDGNLIRGIGQYDVDALVFLSKAVNPRVNVGRWYYYDEYMSGPDAWPPKTDAGKTQQEAWIKQIHDTDGQALIPPPDHKGTFRAGEYQKWLRIDTAPGSAVLWVLYPLKKGLPEPTFQALGDHAVRLTLGNFTEDIGLATAPPANAPGQAFVTRNGAATVLLKSAQVPPLGHIEPRPIPHIDAD